MTETIDRETVITHTDAGLEYVYPPAFEHEVGERAVIGDTWELWLDGELTSVPILYVEIDSRSREYVIDEDEWYVRYHVDHYDGSGAHVATISLTPEDVADQPFGTSDQPSSVVEMVEEVSG